MRCLLSSFNLNRLLTDSKHLHLSYLLYELGRLLLFIGLIYLIDVACKVVNSSVKASRAELLTATVPALLCYHTDRPTDKATGYKKQLQGLSIY